ncbi:MAG: alpha/beta family hydrolase, partial [Anaerolineae bacterium]
TPAQQQPEALTALSGDAGVQVTRHGGWIIFTPAASPSERGLVFYPGGRIDPRAYAPAAHALAAKGILVVIVRMPLNLAVLAPNRAAQVMAAFPGIKQWVVGGHSLGGAMAAAFIFKHPGSAAGLLLWAAYPAGNASLAASSIPVLSISGSLDGLATPEKIEASRALLPADTQWLVIEGGDHAQFGYYGDQAGDNPATISRAEQQQTVVAASARFIGALAP